MQCSSHNVGKFGHIVQADIDLAPLEIRDIGLGKARQLPNIILGKASGLPGQPKIPRENSALYRNFF